MKAKVKDCLDHSLIGMEVKVLGEMTRAEKRDMWHRNYSHSVKAWWCASPFGRGWHLESNLEFLNR